MPATNLAQTSATKQWQRPTISLTRASELFLAMTGDRSTYNRVTLGDLRGLVYRPDFAGFLDANKGVAWDVIEVIE